MQNPKNRLCEKFVKADDLINADSIKQTTALVKSRSTAPCLQRMQSVKRA